MYLSRLPDAYNLSTERLKKSIRMAVSVYLIRMHFLAEKDYWDYVKTWRLEGLTKSIRIAVRVDLINNTFLARKGLLRLCENVAARRAYKMY